MSKSTQSKKIAVTAQLEWPLRRHYDLLEGIQEYAYEQGWELDVGPFPEQRFARGVRFDGIIGRIEEATYHGVLPHKVPMVNTWLNSPVARLLPSVEVDYFEAGRIAAQHLLARGIKKFVYMGVDSSIHYEAHQAGVRSVAAANACSCVARATNLLHDGTGESFKIAFDELTAFFRAAALPLGVVTMTDIVARTIAPIVLDAGLGIPDDVAIVSADDDRLSAADVFPSISSIDMGYHRNGYEAASLLDRIMSGEDLPAQTIHTPPKGLVVRQSSAAFTARDPEVAKALTYMAENCVHLIRVSDIVAQVAMSRDSLERRFKEYTGRTINQELVRMRIERLKRLLVDTNTSIGSLHTAAGFGTVSNMYATFRRAVGVTPAEYRQTRGDLRRWRAKSDH